MITMTIHTFLYVWMTWTSSRNYMKSWLNEIPFSDRAISSLLRMVDYGVGNRIRFSWIKITFIIYLPTTMSDRIKKIITVIVSIEEIEFVKNCLKITKQTLHDWYASSDYGYDLEMAHNFLNKIKQKYSNSSLVNE